MVPGLEVIVRNELAQLEQGCSRDGRRRGVALDVGDVRVCEIPERTLFSGILFQPPVGDLLCGPKKPLCSGIHRAESVYASMPHACARAHVLPSEYPLWL